MAKWTQTLQEASRGSPLQSFLISSRSDYKYGHHGQFLFQIGWYFKNLLLWNHMAKWTQTLQEASVWGPLQSFLISSRLVYKYGCHGQFLFLIGWYLKNFSCEITWPNGTKLYKKHLWEVLYKVSSFHPDRTTNMVATGNSYFWLAEISKIFFYETTWPYETKLYKKHIWKVFYKVHSFHLDGTTNIAATGNFCYWLARSSKLFPCETTCPNITILDRKRHFLILSRLKSGERYRLTWASSLALLLMSAKRSRQVWNL